MLSDACKDYAGKVQKLRVLKLNLAQQLSDYEKVVEAAKDEVRAEIPKYDVSLFKRIESTVAKFTRQPLNSGSQEMVLKAFKVKMRSTSKVVFDVQKDKVVMPYKFRENDVKVTVGPMGFGIRKNVQSFPINSSDDVLFILANGEEIVKNLEGLRMHGVAAALKKLLDEVPELRYYAYRDVFIPFETSVQIEGSVVFGVMVNDMYGQQTAATEGMRSDGKKTFSWWGFNPTRVEGYLMYRQIEEALPKMLEKLEWLQSVLQKGDTEARTKTVLEKWLVMNAL